MARYSKSVLLVDDNPADRVLLSRELQRSGFEVIATGSAEEAMSAIVAGSIGCLITDQIMAVSGQELAAIASGVRSDLCIIFISGASEPKQPLPTGALFVSKENRRQLVDAVSDCMKPWQIHGAVDQ